MLSASPAAGLIRRTQDMTRLLGAALDQAEWLGDETSHAQVGRALAALHDAMTAEMFPAVLELDRDTGLVELPEAVVSGMRRRSILKRDDDWRALGLVCDRARRNRASAADMEDAADRMVLIEARTRAWIARRLRPGSADR
ncbi:hypothetical protein C882_3901 [Caenispirillum salinarum AK4]|uniref:Uncharacterized protein n=1 Tax=Caenispirillum salinarum AK4 TaxID=1238182 RepID=K9HMH6_9PROT|nr:hypothetical protein [Caenispirillum salinarum]EKV31528.1 hypothetical protein C882_3901 [Caenispirillum salinarum AK4]